MNINLSENDSNPVDEKPTAGLSTHILHKVDHESSPKTPSRPPLIFKSTSDAKGLTSPHFSTQTPNTPLTTDGTPTTSTSSIALLEETSPIMSSAVLPSHPQLPQGHFTVPLSEGDLAEAAEASSMCQSNPRSFQPHCQVVGRSFQPSAASEVTAGRVLRLRGRQSGGGGETELEEIQSLVDVKGRLQRPIQARHGAAAQGDTSRPAIEEPRSRSEVQSLESSSHSEKEEGENEASAAASTAPFLMTREIATAKVIETDDMLEVWDENEAGFAWGEKRAKDGSWNERWLQQKTTVARPSRRGCGEGSTSSSSSPPLSAPSTSEAPPAFGRSSGINARLRQRWSASWVVSEDGKKKTTKKIKRYSDESLQNLVEEWEEIIEEMRTPSETSSIRSEVEDGDSCEAVVRTRHEKSGHDYETGRLWKQTVELCETVHKEAGEGVAESRALVEKSSIFEQSEGPEVLKRREIKRKDGSDETCIEVEVRNEGGDSIVTSQLEVWATNADGYKWGRKTMSSPDSSLGEGVFEERWSEQPDGETREVVRWRRNVDGVRGEKIGRSSGGETYNERWEECTIGSPSSYNVNGNSSSSIETSKYLDKWWESPDGHQWGEKVIDRKVMAKAGGAGDGEQPAALRLACSKSTTEKWYDNKTEKVVDSWTTEDTFDRIVEGETPHSIRRLQFGSKIGNRYADGGTEWGEHWLREYNVPTAAHCNQAHNAGRSDDATSGEQSSEPPEGLILKRRYFDRWWREPSGNSWGTKCSEDDIERGLQRHEKWYDNGHEKQVDRWEVDPEGGKHGEKFGEGGSVEWYEKWSGSPATTDHQVEKSWKQRLEDGGSERWGEKFGTEGGRRWHEKWRHQERSEGRSGHQYFEKWDDDGFGQFKTEKEGRTWIDGQTADWYCDRFGESLGKGEKWADKTGCNREGEWSEKWNETPQEKWAAKEGKNISGDFWKEEWKETAGMKTATKSGQNALGDEWVEWWMEDNEERKRAKKSGKNTDRRWIEEWGEEISPDGLGEKWASKQTEDLASGHKWGESWGSRWGERDGKGSHWGESWTNEEVKKWWQETEGHSK